MSWTSLDLRCRRMLPLLAAWGREAKVTQVQAKSFLWSVQLLSGHLATITLSLHIEDIYLTFEHSGRTCNILPWHSPISFTYWVRYFPHQIQLQWNLPKWQPLKWPLWRTAKHMVSIRLRVVVLRDHLSSDPFLTGPPLQRHLSYGTTSPATPFSRTCWWSFWRSFTVHVYKYM